MLSIARLTKRYGEHLLFDLQDFKLDAARAYVLTGMNGAGKSTLLRVLAGLAPADAQGVHFAGEAVTLAPYPATLRREIVYVHQHPVMFSTSVAGNIGTRHGARRSCKPGGRVNALGWCAAFARQPAGHIVRR
jgi:tungstate transport system ATP-binding protein